MTNTTTTTADYLPGEALTGLMTAREWVKRFVPGIFEHMDAIEYEVPGTLAKAFAEITERGHKVATDLGLPLSEIGVYPPVVWELEAARNN